MARWRVCLYPVSLVSLLLLLPMPALAQSFSISAPSSAQRHASFTLTVNATMSPFSSSTFNLISNFPDVSFSEPSWTVNCSGFSSCSANRTIVVTTGNTGGRTLQIVATRVTGSSTFTAIANTWVLGSSTLSPTGLTLQTARTQTLTLALQTSAPLGVTFQLSLSGPAAAGSTVPSTVTVAAGTSAASFTLTAGPNAGSLTVSATTFSAFYTAPAALLIQVLNPTEVATPAGTNVTVTPPVPAGGTVPVIVTFGVVSTAGQTKLLNVSPLPSPPSGYEAPGSPRYFALSTTAVVSGDIRICATYPNAAAADETALRLMALSSGAWSGITSSIDTTTNVICGVTNAIAGTVFGIFRPNSAPVVSAIDGPAAIVAAGAPLQFSATITDADASDTHTGTWVWGDGTTSPADISSAGGVITATGEHTFSTAGTRAVRLVVMDGANNAVSPDFSVTVDGDAPAITSVTATPGSLWPPDSRMHLVTLTVTAGDDTGAPVCGITGVSATAQNVKQTASAIAGPLSVHLKSFPHAIYTVVVTCTDAVGRTATKSVSIAVEKK